MSEPLIDALEGECEALAAAAARTPLDRNVPTCPDWSVAQLLAHAGLFTAQVAGLPWAGNDPYAFAPPEVPDPSVRVDWYAALARDCVDRLRRSVRGNTDGLPPHLIDRPTTFVGVLAREIPIHRWDMENVLGDSEPIPAIVAAAGVDAMCSNFLPAMWRGVGASGKCVRLSATDIELEWTVTFGEGGPAFHRGPIDSATDVTVRGSASDLLLTMFRRPGNAAAVDGDPLAIPRPWRVTGAF